tara:strand:+ start:313 stop:693 length:381 start_codon:yes stop_codon:yes gene_type:complete
MVCFTHARVDPPSVSGRYHKHETARNDFILNNALPGLEFGAFPSDHDDKCLFMAGFTEADERTGNPKLLPVDSTTMDGMCCVFAICVVLFIHPVSSFVCFPQRGAKYNTATQGRKKRTPKITNSVS